MGPTGSAVGLISYVANHTGAFGPLCVGVKSIGNLNLYFRVIKSGGWFYSPGRVDDSSHHFFDTVSGHILESWGNLGCPGGACCIHVLGYLCEVQWLIWLEDSGAESLGGTVVGHWVDGLDWLYYVVLYHREILENLFNLSLICRFCEGDYLVAELTNEIFFTVKIMNSSGCKS